MFCLSPGSGASHAESLTAARALGLSLGRRSSRGSSSSSAGGRCSSWWASQPSSGSFPGGWSFPHDSPSARQRPAAPRSSEAFWDVLKHLRSRNLIGICLGFFCFDYYWYLLVTWLPDYLVTVRHLTILKAGLYASLPYFVWGISEPVGGWIADRLIRWGWDETRSRKGLITVAFITGLLLIPAARVQDAHAAIILIMGASLVGLATGNLFAILQSCAPPEDVGVWTGFENFAGNVGGIIAPAATGFLIARTGSYSARLRAWPPWFSSPACWRTGSLWEN